MSLEPGRRPLSCNAKPAKTHTKKAPPDGRWVMLPLSSVRSLYECRAEVTITHTPSTSDAREIHSQHVEKSISSLALRLP